LRGGGGTLLLRTFTVKVRVANWPDIVDTFSTISRRDSALMVLTDSPAASPSVTVMR